MFRNQNYTYMKCVCCITYEQAQLSVSLINIMFCAHSIQLNAIHHVRMMAAVLLQTHAPAVLDGQEICVEKVCVLDTNSDCMRTI